MPPMEQPLCQPRNWNPGRIFLSNFKTKHSRPREKGLERSVQTDTGGCKKRHLRRGAKHCPEPLFCPSFIGYRIAVLLIASLVLLITVLSPLPASAWNTPGHMLSGAIAYQVLQQESPQTIDKVKAV